VNLNSSSLDNLYQLSNYISHGSKLVVPESIIVDVRKYVHNQEQKNNANYSNQFKNKKNEKSINILKSNSKTALCAIQNLIKQFEKEEFMKKNKIDRFPLFSISIGLNILFGMHYENEIYAVGVGIVENLKEKCVGIKVISLIDKHQLIGSRYQLNDTVDITKDLVFEYFSHEELKLIKTNELDMMSEQAKFVAFSNEKKVKSNKNNQVTKNEQPKQMEILIKMKNQQIESQDILIDKLKKERDEAWLEVDKLKNSLEEEKKLKLLVIELLSQRDKSKSDIRRKIHHSKTKLHNRLNTKPKNMIDYDEEVSVESIYEEALKEKNKIQYNKLGKANIELKGGLNLSLTKNQVDELQSYNRFNDLRKKLITLLNLSKGEVIQNFVGITKAAITLIGFIPRDITRSDSYLAIQIEQGKINENSKPHKAKYFKNYMNNSFLGEANNFGDTNSNLINNFTHSTNNKSKNTITCKKKNLIQEDQTSADTTKDKENLEMNIMTYSTVTGILMKQPTTY
jgi:hypothetical protein